MYDAAVDSVEGLNIFNSCTAIEEDLVGMSATEVAVHPELDVLLRGAGLVRKRSGGKCILRLFNVFTI